MSPSHCDIAAEVTTDRAAAVLARNTSAPAELTEFRTRFPERELNVGGHAWRVREAPGLNGQAFILLAGAQGSGDIHYRLALRLARLGLRSFAVTHPAISDHEAVADGLADLLTALSLDRVRLYGSSIGGYLAQVFAHRHPGRLTTLIIGNSFYDATLSQAKWPPIAEVQAQPSGAMLQAVRRRIAAMEVAEPAQAELQCALLAIVGSHQSADALKARTVALLTAKPIGVVPLAASRVVLVDSDDDPVISRHQREALRRRYAGSRQYNVDGGGHYPSVLRPDDLAQALAAEIDPPGFGNALNRRTQHESRKETNHEISPRQQGRNASAAGALQVAHAAQPGVRQHYRHPGRGE